MSIFPSAAPVLGMDGNGNPINLIVKSDGSAHATGNIEKAAATNPATYETVVEVTALAMDGSKVVATGYSVDNKEALTPTAWIYSGGWATGSAPAPSLRPVGLAARNGKTLISSGEYIYEATFTNQNGTLTNKTTKVSSQVDCLAAGTSVTVGSSLSAIGVWTNTGSNTEWTHVSLGVPSKIYTGHYSTSFTFPGYAGSDAQVQRINAHPAGDNPPSSWDVYDKDAKGYYGVLDPTFTVKWTPTA